MFTELYELARTVNLSLVIVAHETQRQMTINVIPAPKKGCGEPALSRGLSLTATPEAFDADFVPTLQRFREAHTSLRAQAQATEEVLAAAKAASAKKGADAIAKAGAKSKPGTAERSLPASENPPDEDEDAQEDNADTSAPADPAPAANPAEPSLFD